jgi:hypothetical protein
MESMAQSVMSYRHLIYYIIGISVLRGLAVPDFRYGYFSVAVIQVAYPILLLLPLLIEKGTHPGYWGYFFLGLTGIVLSEIVAISRYFLEFWGRGLDSVSGAVIIASFAAMTLLFAVMLALLVYSRS